eukprot:2399232-Alexandrium_andersonii.AAC.1
MNWKAQAPAKSRLQHAAHMYIMIGRLFSAGTGTDISMWDASINSTTSDQTVPGSSWQPNAQKCLNLVMAPFLNSLAANTEASLRRAASRRCRCCETDGCGGGWTPTKLLRISTKALSCDRSRWPITELR